LSKNSGGGPNRRKKTKSTAKFEPGAKYLIIKMPDKPVTAFGSQVLTQERIMFSPQTHDEAVAFFRTVITSTQSNAGIKEKMLSLPIDDFMKEFSDSFNGTFVPFHSTSSFVEKMIELEIFRKAVLQ
jgi:hypothetical protein